MSDDRSVFKVRATGGFFSARFRSNYLAVEDDRSTALYTVSRGIWRNVRKIEDRDGNIVARMKFVWPHNQIALLANDNGEELGRVLVSGMLTPKFSLRLRHAESSYRLEHVGGAGLNLVWHLILEGSVVGEVRVHSVKHWQMEMRLDEAKYLLPALFLGLSWDMLFEFRRSSRC